MTEHEVDRVGAYLGNFAHYYPGIHEWFTRVVNELDSPHRRMFVARDGLGIRGLAITKNAGAISKLCHISVVRGARGHGVGRTLLQSALAGLVASGACEVRVTTSEEVFREHGAFFRTAGFQVIDWEVNRYRKGAAELLWTWNVPPSAISELPAPSSPISPRSAFFGECPAETCETLLPGDLWRSKNENSRFRTGEDGARCSPVRPADFMTRTISTDPVSRTRGTR